MKTFSEQSQATIALSIFLDHSGHTNEWQVSRGLRASLYGDTGRLAAAGVKV